MDDAWRAVTEYPLSPLVPVLLAWAGGIFAHAFRRPRWAAALAAAGLAILWVSSTPAAATALEDALMARQPPRPVAATPHADVILLLGGALAAPRAPHHAFRPTEAVDRVWHAADLYLAGRAPKVLVSAGPEASVTGHEAEAHAIAALLVARGVPRSAILLETRSKTTRENATFSLALVQTSGSRRILLVTSARHMARALDTFRARWPEGLQIIPAAPRPSQTNGRQGLRMWLPTGSALLDVTRCLKEFAGLALTDMI